MEIENKDLKRRICEISYTHKLSHLGSNLTAVDIINEIYQVKKPDERFILSSGHAGLALYTVIEKYEGIDAEKIFEHHGVHPDQCNQCHLDCSTGSLGQGLPIAVGMALANTSKNVYCLVSDGECAEGSIGEALRIANESTLKNLKIYINNNGWAAYKKVGSLWSNFFWADYYGEYKVYPDLDIKLIDITNKRGRFPFLKGLDAHYYTMKEEDYRLALEILK